MNICPRCNEPTYTLDDAKYHRDCAEEEIDRLVAELAICRDAVRKHQQDLFDENARVVELRDELAEAKMKLAQLIEWKDHLYCVTEGLPLGFGEYIEEVQAILTEPEGGQQK